MKRFVKKPLPNLIIGVAIGATITLIYHFASTYPEHYFQEKEKTQNILITKLAKEHTYISNIRTDFSMLRSLAEQMNVMVSIQDRLECLYENHQAYSGKPCNDNPPGPEIKKMLGQNFFVRKKLIYLQYRHYRDQVIIDLNKLEELFKNKKLTAVVNQYIYWHFKDIGAYSWPTKKYTLWSNKIINAIPSKLAAPIAKQTNDGKLFFSRRTNK